MFSSHASELKSQGVEEAARDPSTSVTSDDAQKFMADESKKAGAAAFRFDPNASPEEKAAAAKAVRTLHDSMHCSKLIGPLRMSPLAFTIRRSPEAWVS